MIRRRATSATAPVVRVACGVAVAVAVVLGGDVVAATTPVPAPVTDEATRAVGLVRSAGGNGSGWVAEPGVVVTNLHVARAGTGDIYVDFSDGERVECYTAAVHSDMDLAALRCATGARPALPLDRQVPAAGRQVAAIGYPGSRGPVVTLGEVTGDRREVRGISTVGFTAAIEPGSSGSPVVDEAGRVIAVATFGGGLGVPADEVADLVETAARYPETKAGAEWRLRLRRGVVAAAVVAPIAFVVARRRGTDHPGRSTVVWTLVGIGAAFALTQVQFMTNGPAHFL